MSCPILKDLDDRDQGRALTFSVFVSALFISQRSSAAGLVDCQKDSISPFSDEGVLLLVWATWVRRFNRNKVCLRPLVVHTDPTWRPTGPWLSVAFPVCTYCPFRSARASSSLNTASLGSHVARAPMNRWGRLAQLRLSPNRWLDSHRELPRGVYLGSLHSTERLGMF